MASQTQSAPARNSEQVTLCAWMRTVRYESEWISVEAYLERRFGILTSHGISPEAEALIESDVAPVPGRLAAVRATGLLDSAPTQGFDRLTRLGARLLSVPATFISLVDDGRDFYLSHCGFSEPLASARQLTGQTFCHFTIEREVPLVIPDTRADARYRQVPTVESLGVAAYLGVPLVLLSGEVIGAFCAIDQVPREWTELQIQDAVDLASLVVSEIELRQAAINSQHTRL